MQTSNYSNLSLDALKALKKHFTKTKSPELKHVDEAIAAALSHNAGRLNTEEMSFIAGTLCALTKIIEVPKELHDKASRAVEMLERFKLGYVAPDASADTPASPPAPPADVVAPAAA